jgi:hypothetical protein
VLSNKDCCEGSCVQQGLSGSGLRHGDLHRVACWIRSSSSGDVHRVVGRFLSGLTRCERLGQNSKDHRRVPYHVVSDYWVSHCEYFWLIDLRIVPQFPDQIGCKLFFTYEFSDRRVQLGCGEKLLPIHFIGVPADLVGCRADRSLIPTKDDLSGVPRYQIRSKQASRSDRCLWGQLIRSAIK